MLYVGDIVLIDETHNGVNDRLEVETNWKLKGFKLSKTKTEYL